MSRSLPALIALAFASACHTGSDLSAADLASYDRTASDLSAEVQAYRGATAAMSSTSECLAALQQHLARVRPGVAAMGPLAGRIGDAMVGMGATMANDMHCGMDLISREVERHAAAACGSADMAANRAEAARHCDELQGAVDHMRMRGAEAGGMMRSGSGMMGPGPGMMDWDGGAGWTMPDGGTMPWDHRMPGCGADGG